MLISLLAMCCNEEEKKKIEYVYLHYGKTVFYIINQQVNNHSVVEDLVHDLFVKLIEMSDRLDISDPDKLKSFLAVLARHTASDFNRKKKKSLIDDAESAKIFDFLSDESAVSPLDFVMGHEYYEKILACVERLGEKNKSIFRLKYFFGYSNAEIAKLLNMSSTKEVSYKLYREKKMLMKMIGGDSRFENRQEKRDAF